MFGHGEGESTSVNFFYHFLYVELQKHSFLPIFSNWYFGFWINSRVKPTIFFIEKISFSLKRFSGDFNGQSFIKTEVLGIEHMQIPKRYFNR